MKVDRQSPVYILMVLIDSPDYPWNLERFAKAQGLDEVDTYQLLRGLHEKGFISPTSGEWKFWSVMRGKTQFHITDAGKEEFESATKVA